MKSAILQNAARGQRETSTLIEASGARNNAGHERLGTVTWLIQMNRELNSRVDALIEQVSVASAEQALGISQIS